MDILTPPIEELTPAAVHMVLFTEITVLYGEQLLMPLTD